VRVLLDTHAFLAWSSAGGARLTERARDVLADAGTEVLLSAASGFEIATKATRGRLELPDDPRRFIPSRVARYGFHVLPISLEHAVRAGILPDIHRDPFDRILIAQAQVEGLPILTADPLIARYDVETIW
jgi:PIN domain nuclease of toxin-antitoxin system